MEHQLPPNPSVQPRPLPKFQPELPARRPLRCLRGQCHDQGQCLCSPLQVKLGRDLGLSWAPPFPSSLASSESYPSPTRGITYVTRICPLLWAPLFPLQCRSGDPIAAPSLPLNPHLGAVGSPSPLLRCLHNKLWRGPS